MKKVSKNHRANFEAIKNLLDDAETDADKFFGNNNKSAGTRLRVKLAKIMALAKEARKDVTERKELL